VHALVPAEAELDRDRGARLERIHRWSRVDGLEEPAEAVGRPDGRQYEVGATDIAVVHWSFGPDNTYASIGHEEHVVERVVDGRAHGYLEHAVRADLIEVEVRV